MQIYDEDMQMVRDFLATSEAPEYIKGHFENLLTQYDAAEARASDLADEVEEKRGACVERDDLQEEVDDLTEELEGFDSDLVRALTAVKYWFHDFFYTNQTTKTADDARRMLRLVEEALGQ